MDLLKLPVRDVPEHKHQRPPEVLYAWRAETIRRLKESGRMARIRQQASRQPAADRFVL